MQEKPQGRFLKTAVLVTFFVLFAYLLKNFNIFDAEGLLTDLHVMGDTRFVKLVFVGVATVLLIFFVPVSTVAATAGLLFELDGILLITISGLLSALVSYGLAKIFKSDATRWVEKLYQRKEREIPLEELYEKIKDHGSVMRSLSGQFLLCLFRWEICSLVSAVSLFGTISPPPSSR